MWECGKVRMWDGALLHSVSVNLAELRRVAPWCEQVRSVLRGWYVVRSLNVRQGRLRGRGHGRLLSEGRGRGARKAGQGEW